MAENHSTPQPLPSVRINWQSAIDRLTGAYADSTLRAYRSDFAAFDQWCAATSHEALPADPETVAAFIAYDATKSSPATLRRRLAGIRKVHRLLRLGNPVDDEDVAIAMRRALRTKPRRQKQALGLTRTLRDQLIATCPDTLQGKRDRALIAVGYDTLCRRAELVSLRRDDLSSLENGAMSILVRRAKNDPFGDGRYGFIAPPTARLLMDWLDAAKIEQGFLFRRITGPWIGPNALHPYSVNRILKETAKRAGLAPKVIADLSGHSMRVGAAHDLMADGLGILPIMQAGGWKSMNVIGRYVEHAEIGLLAKLRSF